MFKNVARSISSAIDKVNHNEGVFLGVLVCMAVGTFFMLQVIG